MPERLDLFGELIMPDPVLILDDLQIEPQQGYVPQSFENAELVDEAAAEALAFLDQDSTSTYRNHSLRDTRTRHFHLQVDSEPFTVLRGNSFQYGGGFQSLQQGSVTRALIMAVHSGLMQCVAFNLRGTVVGSCGAGKTTFWDYCLGGHWYAAMRERYEREAKIRFTDSYFSAKTQILICRDALVRLRASTILSFGVGVACLLKFLREIAESREPYFDVLSSDYVVANQEMFRPWVPHQVRIDDGEPADGSLAWSVVSGPTPLPNLRVPQCRRFWSCSCVCAI